MRIEIDTKHDTKEELAHLATMLNALSNTASVSTASSIEDFADSRLQRRLAKKGLFHEDPPDISRPEPLPDPDGGGLFNLFNDDSPSNPAHSEMSPVASEPAQGGLFSLFGSDPSPAATPEPAPSQPAQMFNGLEILEPMNSSQAGSTQLSSEPESDEGKSAQDLLDDDRIVPY